MKPIQLFDPASSTCTYLLFDQVSREALIIDPVDEQIERDLAVLREYGLKLVWTVETHAHADHITSAGQLAELAGAKTAAPVGCGIGTAGVQLSDGDTLRFGGETLLALHTPGHTAGSMSFVWRDHVFTGDTLLINGCGRTDFQSGSASALYDSITRVLFALPESTTVWPGHDYQCRRHSSIGEEKASNARIAGKSEAEFVALMDALNLPRPKRIDEAVPANLSSGLRHDLDGALLMQPRPAQANLAGSYAGDVSPPLAWRAAGRRRRQKTGAAVPQRRALHRRCPARHATGSDRLQHLGRFRGRSRWPCAPRRAGWLAAPWFALAAELSRSS